MIAGTADEQLKTQPRGRRNAAARLSELFGSMRFAISLLVVLAIASIIGTVLKQEDPYPNYVNQFGPFWADIFRALGLYTVYDSWWFIAILLFLVISLSICVTRNGPKMIADMRSWKDRVREGSLRAFGHKAQYQTNAPYQQTAARIEQWARREGYRTVQRETEGAILIAAKRGAFAKLGYIFAHTAIIVICIGALLDSSLAVRAQMWLFGKTPVQGNAVIASIGPEHRLSPSNPSFRGYAWVPEGEHVSTAILNQPDGALIQDLPFTLQLNKFIVEYYSTGMPRLFASDIVLTDKQTGRKIPARIEVNKPFTYRGISIYQSSFEDGGSHLAFSAYPMTGDTVQPVMLDGTVGSSAPVPNLPDQQGLSAPAHRAIPKSLGRDTIEFSGFRAINVEPMQTSPSATATHRAARSRLAQWFENQLGSGARSVNPQNLHNVGPSVQYRIRDAEGQAREYDNYMLPVMLNGQAFILSGMRASPDAPFRYLRIPADDDGSVKQWMLLRAALQNPQLRLAAARRFAAQSMKLHDAELQAHLQESALRVLTLFAGAEPAPGDTLHRTVPSQNGVPAAGFTAIAALIEQTVPANQQEKAAGLLRRLLEGSVWELWQIARQQNGQPPLPMTQANSEFIDASINALSDSFLYGAPILLQLDSFKQVQASVFQLARAPGQSIVYLGSFLLVTGIFSMFYIRERRLWLWIKPSRNDGEPSSAGMHSVPAQPLRGSGAQTEILMAMSSARRTLDFETEFARTRAALDALFGAPIDTTHAGPAETPVELPALLPKQP